MKNPKVYLVVLLLSLVVVLPVKANILTLINSETSSNTGNNSFLQQAQILNQKGAAYLVSGKADMALKTWQRAHRLYTQAQDQEGIIGTRINQAQALQSLGFYRQALLTLQSVNNNLQKQPNSALKIQGLLSLGNSLRAMQILEGKNVPSSFDDKAGSKEILMQALIIANTIHEQGLVEQVNLSLGNTLQLLGSDQISNAIDIYRELLTASNPLLRIQAQINLYRLEAAEGSAGNTQEVIEKIRKELDLIPPSRHTIYAYINLAETVKKSKESSLNNQDLLIQIAKLLTTATEQSTVIKDDRSKVQAIGSLANLYEINLQYSTAQSLTEQALFIAENLPAPDLAYNLHWQMGRILTARKSHNSAIISYRQSINHLKSLRDDLNALNPDIQFSFRNSVEPVYRELVALLLKDGEKASEQSLLETRDLIESLQVVELQSFLHQSCIDSDIDTKKVEIDKIDKSAAVIYPILLPDRVAVIAALPQQPLRYYSQKESLPAATVQLIVTKLRDKIENSEFTPQQEKTFHKQSKQIYDSILAPLANDLQKTNTKTLVFVLDGILRNMPMSALYDGEKYLVEKYNLALTPGLRLLPPKGLASREKIQVFSGGITDSRQGFVSLPNVRTEIEAISNLIPNQPLFNADFNNLLVSLNLASNNSQIIHLATHGQFSSRAEETFLLTWDDRINLYQLNNLLKIRNNQPDKAINLLVLSACQTAKGDDRATLGLAGVAVRAGARSTIASLWSVSDEATQVLMSQLYQNLVTTNLDKAESLKMAQQHLLRSTKYRSPFYWSAFVLVGNWQ
jgi:CHAT domain-containing protein